MRLAFSSQDNEGIDSRIAPHFGRCPYFILVDLDGKEIIAVEGIVNPFYPDHEPGMVPNFIKEQKADVMISGGMGGRAIAYFNEFGIQTATGAAGTVQESIALYLDGKLTGAKPCSDSEAHHH
ncbi:MAG: NifB/NifX family molybdenum-iron cluster-binding protein [Anaerolineales bacterium]|nr:NifB/NifX family molybdenum-iron cluster-binding protein [Anaerolineales bacterium]